MLDTERSLSLGAVSLQITTHSIEVHIASWSWQNNVLQVFEIFDDENEKQDLSGISRALLL